MREGRCIKCGGEVRQLTGGVHHGRQAPTYVRSSGAISTASSYETFLCTACGYFENYVTDADKLRSAAAGDGGWARPA